MSHVLMLAGGRHQTSPGSAGHLQVTSRCRCDGGHGPEDGEGVADTTSSRLEGVRPVTASRSACVVGGR